MPVKRPESAESSECRFRPAIQTEPGSFETVEARPSIVVGGVTVAVTGPFVDGVFIQTVPTRQCNHVVEEEKGRFRHWRWVPGGSGLGNEPVDC